jgi:hypothetical protein
MSDASSSPVIFISYAYADEPETPAGGGEQWLTFVMKFLQPAVKGGVFEVCGDRRTRGGADWGPEIESKRRACDIFILLMSANAMASDIVDKELAVIRERQKQGKPVHLCALLLTPTPKTGLDKAGDKNLRPRDARPLSASAGHDRAQRMTEVVNEIAEIADGIAKQKNAAQKKAARLAMWRRAIVLGSVVAGAPGADPGHPGAHAGRRRQARDRIQNPVEQHLLQDRE